MTGRARTAALAALLVVIGAITAIDRLGAARADAGADSLRNQYVSEVSLVAEMRESIAGAPEWDAAQSAVSGRWREIQSRLLIGESVDIAYARLRAVVETTMRELGVALEATGSLRANRLVEDEPLHSIGIRIECAVADPALVYQLIDRLENLPDAMINVETVEIAGPGRLGRSVASVAIELRSLAWIGRAQ